MHSSLLLSPNIIQEPLDLLLIIGPDRDGKNCHQIGYEKIKSLCDRKKLNYLILGDGKSDVYPEDLHKLPKVRHAINWSHGSNINDEHSIKLNKKSIRTLDIFTTMQSITGCKSIINCSCHSSKITSDFEKQYPKEKLLPGSMLINSSSAKEVCFTSDNQEIILSLIEQIEPGINISMIKFFSYLIKSHPQTIQFVYQPEQDIGHHSSLQYLTLKRKSGNTYSEVQQLYTRQLSLYQKFIHSQTKNTQNHDLIREFNNIRPNFYNDLTMLDENSEVSLTQPEFFSSKMTIEEVKIYKEKFMGNCINHNDVKTMDTILQNNKFSAVWLFIVMRKQAADSTINLKEMFSLFLKNEKNVTHGQNVNAFFTEMSSAEREQIIQNFGSEQLDAAITHTPLTMAIELGLNDFIHSLIEYGADLYLKDKAGRMPALMINESKNCKLILNKMRESFDNVHKKKNYLLKTMNFLLKHTGDVDISIFPDLTSNILNTLSLLNNFQTDYPAGKILTAEENLKKIYDNQKCLMAYNKIVKYDVLLEFCFKNNLKAWAKEISQNDETFKKAIALGDVNLLRITLWCNPPENFYIVESLYTQVSNRNHKMVLVLSQNTNLSVKEEENLLKVAVKSGSASIFNLLLPLCTNALKNFELVHQLLHIAGESSSVTLWKRLIEISIEIHGINSKNKEGKVIFHAVAAFGMPELISILVKQGADINAKDNQGKTPLHIAAEGKSYSYVMKYDDDFHKINFISKNSGQLQIFESLLANKADHNIQDDNKKIFIDYLSSDMQSDIKLLMKKSALEFNLEETAILNDPIININTDNKQQNLLFFSTTINSQNSSVMEETIKLKQG